MNGCVERVRLLDETKLLLRKFGISPKRRMGQRFLVDEGVLSRQVEYARLHTGDVVLEIGAGTGNLTKYLVKGDWDVVVIERDSSLVKLLRHRFHDAPNLKVIHGDVLRMKFPKFNKVVSNIPYAISASLTFKLLEHNFELAILTYQREFAERLIAKPGTRNYSRISVSTYCKADVKILEYVSRNAFYPAPQVSSAVVKITPKTKPLAVEEDVFQNLLRGLFSHRRKTLPNATFHSYSFLTGCNPPKDLKRANIRRFIPEHLWDKKVYELTPEEFTEISKALAPLRGRKYNKPTVDL